MLKKIISLKNYMPIIVIALILAVAGPVLADKPSWAGGKSKGGKHQQKEYHNTHNHQNDGYSQDHHDAGVSVNVFFGDEQRRVIHDYYTEQYHSGHCPPGLAKKNDRCMAPGQIKKWQVGRPLPRDVIFHDLPPEVVVQLGPPPSGHRFVRVASDILLIAEGTGMIIDAIQDLGEQ